MTLTRVYLTILLSTQTQGDIFIWKSIMLYNNNPLYLKIDIKKSKFLKIKNNI